MSIQIIPTGITQRQIEIYRTIMEGALKRRVSDAVLGQMLVRVGAMDGWPQLAKLEEMEATIHDHDFDKHAKETLKWGFVELCVVVENKTRLAWHKQTGEVLDF